jgi:hypothetical protein
MKAALCWCLICACLLLAGLSCRELRPVISGGLLAATILFIIRKRQS